MDEKKQGSGSASSFTAELFGITESPPSNRIFDSIFSPPPPVPGRKSGGREAAIGSWQKQSSGNQVWATREGTTAVNKDRSSMADEERVEPCKFSSSIYYGAQDSYSQSPPYNVQTGRSYPIFKKDGGEDGPATTAHNSQSASRGNWFALLLGPLAFLIWILHLFFFLRVQEFIKYTSAEK